MNAGFVIGCSHYDDHDIANLTYAHQDASRFEDVLRSTWGFGDEEIISFYDGHADPRLAPTRANILRQISRGPRLSDGVAIDLLVFFFSGHGFRSTLNDADYLLTQDSWTTALEDTALQFDSIVRRLQPWMPRHADSRRIHGVAGPEAERWRDRRRCHRRDLSADDGR
jgi:molecular chaperone DnaK